jgi:hypothetical protein
MLARIRCPQAVVLSPISKESKGIEGLGLEGVEVARGAALDGAEATPLEAPGVGEVGVDDVEAHGLQPFLRQLAHDARHGRPLGEDHAVVLVDHVVRARWWRRIEVAPDLDARLLLLAGPANAGREAEPLPDVPAALVIDRQVEVVDGGDLQVGRQGADEGEPLGLACTQRDQLLAVLGLVPEEVEAGDRLDGAVPPAVVDLQLLADLALQAGLEPVWEEDRAGLIYEGVVGNGRALDDFLARHVDVVAHARYLLAPASDRLDDDVFGGARGPGVPRDASPHPVGFDLRHHVDVALIGEGIVAAGLGAQRG